jgi:acetolactate decarboxylase
MADDQENLSLFVSFLPPELLNQLRISSERTGCAPTELIEKALRRFLVDTSKDNAVYLSAPINALVEGLYVENTTMAEIKKHGDFGLGTFNFLDGEMVLLDGHVYQIRSDGNVYQVKDDEKSPFACVTFFNPDTIDDLENSNTSKGFYELLTTLIPSENMLYAIRIDGTFSHVKTRVVPRSENYRPLVEATKNQPVFDFHDVRGCLAGFYTPRFMDSLNAPGYHMHFLSDDRQHGGHLIECVFERVKIGIQHVPKLDVGLPITLDYLTADLTRDVGNDLDKAEH